MTTNLLILGGTAEATKLAGLLVGRPGLRIVSSLAGRTTAPHLPPGEVRIGGFGGHAGLSGFLRDETIDVVVDATHPFATRMGWNADRACAAAAIPLLRLERPAWLQQPGDRWDEFDTWEEAAQLLRRQSRRVLLALGRQNLAPFADLGDVWCLIRSVDRPEPPPAMANAAFISSRGPFTLEAELALLSDNEVDTIVCKNSGGPAGYAKIEAARALGLGVVMLRRPLRPDLPWVTSPEDAAVWLESALMPYPGDRDRSPELPSDGGRAGAPLPPAP
jgi:precorrin-6A/cobalt-precorrin-6A reductase